jgi:hypothetical protein
LPVSFNDELGGARAETLILDVFILVASSEEVVGYVRERVQTVIVYVHELDVHHRYECDLLGFRPSGLPIASNQASSLNYFPFH